MGVCCRDPMTQKILETTAVFFKEHDMETVKIKIEKE